MPTKPQEEMDPPSKKSSSSSSYRQPFFIKLAKFVAENPQNVENKLKQLRKERIRRLQDMRQSQLIVYYSLDSLDRRDVERFYEVLTTLENVKNLDLFLSSPGGLSDPAFKMAYLCQECVGEGRFSVLIPHYAKSAATILALGADELVMGPPSELGPIDPQLRMSAKKPPLPLHALRDALQYIEQRATTDLKLAFLYRSLIDSLELMSLGHYDREIQGAQQYAEYLLSQRMFKEQPAKAKEVSRRLTAQYKRHSYVITRREARQTLQLNVKDASPAEWELIWQLHHLYDHYVREAARRRNPAKVIETANILLRP